MAATNQYHTDSEPQGDISVRSRGSVNPTTTLTSVHGLRACDCPECGGSLSEKTVGRGFTTVIFCTDCGESFSRIKHGSDD